MTHRAAVELPESRPVTKKKQHPRKRNRSIVYIILGVLFLLVPVGLTHWKNIEQQRISEDYSRNVAQLSVRERDAALAAAREYNAQIGLNTTAHDPWTTGLDRNSPEYQRYLSYLDVDSVMARVKVPSVGIDLPVYHGTSNSTLAHGIGHLYGTHLPVGGEGTHSVLTGHTGLATLTMFDNLINIEMGDVFTVEVMGETLAYKVDQIEVVLPHETELIRPEAGRDFMTLITCTPYGINTHRLLVRGERTELPRGVIERKYTSPWQPWMIAALLISLAALLYLLLWLLRRRQRDSEHGNKQENI